KLHPCFLQSPANIFETLRGQGKKSGAREMDGGLLLGAVGGAARANQNKAKIVKMAVRAGHAAAAAAHGGGGGLHGARRPCPAPRLVLQQPLRDDVRALPDQPGLSFREEGRSGADAGGPALLRGGRRRVLRGARAQAVQDPSAVPRGCGG
uniref:Uncharacterized protein n=1 Tax=Aegilops tauschii subsp. strangulata TaxID=200361 RepID=A0A453B6A6_AEGTS